MSIQPYSGSAPECEKCGELVATQHVPQRAGLRPFTSTIPEHLNRTCAGCGFSWQESPKPTAKPLLESRVPTHTIDPKR